MANAKASELEESYPWDSVWEYILDDKNFEEGRPPKKKTWSNPPHHGGAEDGFDSDSAYEEEPDEQDFRRNTGQQREPKRVTYLRPQIQAPVTLKPSRSKRFGWLKRFKRKSKSSKEPVQRSAMPREQPKVRFQEEGRDYLSDVGAPSFLQARTEQRRDDDDCVSVSGNQSVVSETGSVFQHLIQWGKPKEVETNNVSDDDSLSDEVSVMESFFNNFEERRSDFEVEEENRYRAKQKWRSRDRSQERPREIRPSYSTDRFDTRDAGSVHSTYSSQSRRSRSSRYGHNDMRYREAPKIVSDDISVVNYLLETQGGYLVHVPSSIAFAPGASRSSSSRRRNSFQAY